MSYADTLQDRLQQLRALREDMLIEGKTTQAAYMQREIHEVYDRLCAVLSADY